MDNVCNRCLFSIPSKVEMAEEQEYWQPFNLAKFQAAAAEASKDRLPLYFSNK